MPRIVRVPDTTGEFSVRDYGLVMPPRAGAHSGWRIFKSPAYAAMAIIGVCHPSTIAGMYDSWRMRKTEEREMRAGYIPRFQVDDGVFEKFVAGDKDRGLEAIREKVKRNHGTYKLFDAYGREALEDIDVLGNDLTALSASGSDLGKYNIHLDGIILDSQGRISFGTSRCGCKNNSWGEVKGGVKYEMAVHCRHIEMPIAELVYDLTGNRHQGKQPITFKGKVPNVESIARMFDFQTNDYLTPLVFDIFFAKEVLRDSYFDINQKLLSREIAPEIFTKEGLDAIRDNRAWFEILRQGPVKDDEDPMLLKAKETINKEFGIHLRRNGYKWARYCLEMGEPVMTFQNENHSVRLAMNGKLPFYVIRRLNVGKKRGREIFPAQSQRSNDAFRLFAYEHDRVDDRTRYVQPCLIMPCTGIKLPEMSEEISLKNRISPEVVERYRERIAEKEGRHASKKLKQLHLN